MIERGNVDSNVLGNKERIDEYINRHYIGSKFIEYSNKSGRGTNFAVGVTGIVTLEQYIKEKEPETMQQINSDIEQENSNQSGAFVVPIVLPTGEILEVVVSNEGEELASIITGEDGSKSVRLPSKMMSQILNNVNGIQVKIDPSLIKDAVVPNSLEELQRDLAEENLIPENSDDVVRKLKERYPDVKAEVADEESFKSIAKTQKKLRSIWERVPEEVREEVAEMRNKEGIDIDHVQEILVAPAKKVNSAIPRSGIDITGEDLVYCVVFNSSKNNTVGSSAIILQPGRNMINERQYDDEIVNFVKDNRQKTLNRQFINEHQAFYTDIDGNTTVQEIHKEPRDLTVDKKLELQKRLMELEEEVKHIMDNPDILPEDKGRALIEINGKRNELFNEYGVYPNLVISEIDADTEIIEEIVDKQKTEAEQAESQEEEGPSIGSKYVEAKGREHELPEGPWDRPNNHYQ